MHNLPDPADLDASAPDFPGQDRALILPPHGTTVTAEDLRVRMVLASDFERLPQTISTLSLTPK